MSISQKVDSNEDREIEEKATSTTEGVYEDTPEAAAKRREKALADAAAKASQESK